ncbi:MAG TPA: cupin domain-containing protein [Stellaceae bacterium]|jgi:mannose-6-phosphate isomerase-like protein (cupin superfamily)|nr:cupin domain-containing protein [Stellaceae bacterium]
MSDVKVIAARFTDRPKTDPNDRIFKIDDHIKTGEAYHRSTRLYVGDDFRTTLITLTPGQAQETHKHPETSHAWFIVSGKGEVEMEDGKRVAVEPGWFSVHPRNSVHGLYNTGGENLTYIALSVGQ